VVESLETDKPLQDLSAPNDILIKRYQHLNCLFDLVLVTSFGNLPPINYDHGFESITK
jgi:hypothetical protein